MSDNKSTALVRSGDVDTYSRDQVDLIKRTIAKGATDDELALFVGTAKRLRLDPFARQIFAIKRWDSDTNDWGLTNHVSIDGLRLIADRTGVYMPSPEEPVFSYNAKNELVKAMVYVQKWSVLDAKWHPVPATALFDEYAGKKKAGGLTKNWADKPHVMLAKCAEALAIRKAFPNETSGVYISEEFRGDDIEVVETRTAPPPPVPPVVQRPAPPPKPAPPPPRNDGPTAKGREVLEREHRRSQAADRRDPDTADETFGPSPVSCKCHWHAPELHEALVGCTACRDKGEPCGCKRGYAEILSGLKFPPPPQYPGPSPAPPPPPSSEQAPAIDPLPPADERRPIDAVVARMLLADAQQLGAIAVEVTELVGTGRCTPAERSMALDVYKRCRAKFAKPERQPGEDG